MIRMLSGLTAPVVGVLGGLFKDGGEVSAYRVVLAGTLAALGWGLWAGWAQWVILGSGLAVGGPGACLGTFLARWAMLAWLAIVLLWPFCDDADEIVSGCISVVFLASVIGTFMQFMHVCDAFAVAERTHYSVAVSCRHCSASCDIRVGIGESWTDWERVECCRCGIAVPPKMVPEYTESREAWDARVTNEADD